MEHEDIRIMIVEDRENREEYRALLKKHTKLRLVAESDNQEESLKILQETQIDAMILDLEIQNGSGILLLQKLQTLDIKKPFIEVVTNIISRQAYEPVRMMGADYICSKSSINYSLDIPLSILEICMSCRKEQIPKGPAVKEMYRQRIHIILKEMGFSSEMQGTGYLEEGILYMVLEGKMMISTTKELYPYIARKFKVNAGNVERSIRVAIEKVWTKQDLKRLQELYAEGWNKDTGRPANTKFIRTIARKVTA